MASLSIMLSTSTHLPTNFTVLFLFAAEYDFTVYRQHISITYSSSGGQLGCFHVVDIVKMNMAKHVSLWGIL